MAHADPTLRFLETTVDLAVVHASSSGVITAWRGAAERVLGYSEEEAIGKSLSLFFTPEDIARGLDAQEIASALVQGRSEDDRWHLRKDGGRFWASGVLSRVELADGSVGLCKFLRDKTDVKTQIGSLETTVALLKTRLAAEKATIGSIAHELRNPLMPIVTALALLQRPDAAHLAAQATKTLASQVELLRRLIADLDAVGSDEPAPQLDLEPVNLTLVLEHWLAAFRLSPTAAQRQVSLVIPTESIWIEADPDRLQQILLNLLGNAVKYTDAGGRIGVTATIEDAMAVVRVADDGIGISADMLPRIFDLFTREGRSPDVEGKGVGLAVVKQLVAAHGGVIDVRSAGFDLGSTFSLRIPTTARRAAPGDTSCESVIRS